MDAALPVRGGYPRHGLFRQTCYQLFHFFTYRHHQVGNSSTNTTMYGSFFSTGCCASNYHPASSTGLESDASCDRLQNFFVITRQITHTQRRHQFITRSISLTHQRSALAASFISVKLPLTGAECLHKPKAPAFSGDHDETHIFWLCFIKHAQDHRFTPTDLPEPVVPATNKCGISPDRQPPAHRRYLYPAPRLMRRIIAEFGVIQNLAQINGLSFLFGNSRPT